MTDVSSAPGQRVFPKVRGVTNATKFYPVRTKKWYEINCDEGIQVLIDGTDPEYRERVLARERKKRRLDD